MDELKITQNLKRKQSSEENNRYVNPIIVDFIKKLSANKNDQIFETMDQFQTEVIDKMNESAPMPGEQYVVV